MHLKRYWRDQYPDHLGAQVDEVVEAVYGGAMVARIALADALMHDER